MGKFDNEYLKSFVNHNGKWFLITTKDTRYNHEDNGLLMSVTTIEEWDYGYSRVGGYVGEFPGMAGSSSNHIMCIEFLLKNGSLGGIDEMRIQMSIVMRQNLYKCGE